MTNRIMFNETHKYYRYSCILWHMLRPFFSPCHFLRPSHVYSASFGVFGFAADSIVSPCVVLHMISYFLCSIQSKYLNRIVFIFHRILGISLLFHTHFIHWERRHLFIKLTNNGQFKESGIAMRRIAQGLVRCDENSVWMEASPFFLIFKRI